MRKRITIALMLLLAGLGLVACARKLPVGAADKDVVLRAADLIPYGYGLERTEPYETFKRVRNIDGTQELTYQFETPPSEHEHALVMNVSVTVETTEVGARNLQGAKEIGISIGLKATGVKQREIENFYRYGDASRFAVLEKNSHPIGNVFVVRDGKRLFVLIMSGMYFEDAATFQELVEGRLKKFSAYAPT
jgi:hypothetical protein